MIVFEKDNAALDMPGKHYGHIRLPHSADDSAWGHVMIPLVVINGTRPGQTALVMGGTHGDEYEGPIAIRHLIDAATPETIFGRLIAIPALNAPAFRAATRTSPLDGVNLNRAFPGAASGTITQKIAAVINDTLIPMADLVIDLHSGGKTLDFLPMAVSHILDDADQDHRCATAARAFGAPWTARLREIDDTGMLDGAAERAGRTFVTTELGGAGTATAVSAEIAISGLRNVLAHHVHYDWPAGARPSRGLDLSDPGGFHFATHGGLFHAHVALGDTVEQHQKLADIYNVDDLCTVPKSIHAQRPGILAARHVPGLIKPGDCAFVIGTDEGPIGFP
ncbi:succinylglutamate desuccinylase/aspartoacylase family protein [Rhodobacteraceae bacterium N5(2021)]|uniref:Succinylglutamate desuccinylase/aspartoacylase family protein n=1 Tax=Gymnodinialimonas phycosphaerae TaxID=2841589 RepID=A0A975YFL7_9RHOB|nr:succinylglutamate desuccinylase/aspartoacylase family protein [Gymnodinialimonas phycosphaerae]MBY4894915.1 succinylglutamate desuccinylase/aspartoacylase family protein [Gymnodinialimonas phycosphaerae]